MDKTQEYNSEYIKQCAAAYPLIALKLKFGFDEGDRVWDGEKVRLVCHDFINVTEKFDKMNPHFQFAMLKADDEATIDFGEHPLEMHMQYGEYIVDTIYHPVWIPTADQLQNMLGYVDYTTLLSKFIHFTNYHNSYNKLRSTKEQMWLDYYMWKKFNVLWDYLEKKWEINTHHLSEE